MADLETSHATIDHTGLTGVGGGTATFVGARVRRTTNQAIPATTPTAITFDAERYDTDAFHDTGANTSRLTIPSGKAGKYLIGFAGEVASSPGAGSWVGIRLNGTTFIALQYIVSQLGVTISTQYDLAETDYVEAIIHLSGAMNLNATGNYSPEFYLAVL